VLGSAVRELVVFLFAGVVEATGLGIPTHHRWISLGHSFDDRFSKASRWCKVDKIWVHLLDVPSIASFANFENIDEFRLVGPNNSPILIVCVYV